MITTALDHSARVFRLLAGSAGLLLAACVTVSDGLAPYRVQGDEIVQPLAAMRGDPARGRVVVAGRDGNCLLCHAIAETGERFMGNVGPPLSHVATRLTEGQLRLRIVDPTRLNGSVTMPAYYRTRALDEVATPFRGKPILSAQQIEDAIAYLLTLR